MRQCKANGQCLSLSTEILWGFGRVEGTHARKCLRLAADEEAQERSGLAQQKVLLVLGLAPLSRRSIFIAVPFRRPGCNRARGHCKLFRKAAVSRVN
jgi:hypothetical protein